MTSPTVPQRRSTSAVPDVVEEWKFNSSLDGNTRRALDIREDDELDEEAFTALVRAAVDMNAG